MSVGRDGGDDDDPYASLLAVQGFEAQQHTPIPLDFVCRSARRVEKFPWSIMKNEWMFTSSRT
jgi:hypothetical protein